MNTKKRKELTADDVWAMFAASDARLEKMFAETNEQMKRTDARLDKRLAESDARSDKRLAESDARLKNLEELIGGIGNNAGFHAEQFFQDSLAQTLMFGGQKYDCLIPNLMCTGKNDKTDFDIVLVNGKSVAIIEVKNRIHPNFVKQLAEERIAKFRKFFPVYQKHKAYLGIAGFSFSKAVQEEAKKYGVGIIKQVGQSIEVEADKLKAY